MNVTLQTLPATRVAFLRHTGPYGDFGIPATWKRLEAWFKAEGLAEPRREMFGLGLDNPATTPPDQCRYDACVAVDTDFQPKDDIRVQVIPGGLCACTDFLGTAADIADAWMRFCRDWLPASPWQFDARPCFERYAPDFDQTPEPGLFRCQLCIPVKAKQPE